MTQFHTLVKLTLISLFTVATGVSLGLMLLILSAPLDQKMALSSAVIEPNIQRLPGPLYASMINIDTLVAPQQTPVQNTDIEDEDDSDGESDCS